MDYPGNFDTPAFPAGRRIAISRFMGTAALVLFFLIICACGLVLWASDSVRINPVLITINKYTGVWRVVERSPQRVVTDNPLNAMQESVVANFALNWFSISSSATDNTAAWGKCADSVCTGAETMSHAGRKCGIYCAASDRVYMNFSDNVMPNYALRSNAGEVWTILRESVQITPLESPKPNGGVWQIYGRVWSNINGEFPVVAFARTARDTTRYPMTLGYFISDFNAYRLR